MNSVRKALKVRRALRARKAKREPKVQRDQWDLQDPRVSKATKV